MRGFATHCCVDLEVIATWWTSEARPVGKLASILDLFLHLSFLYDSIGNKVWPLRYCFIVGLFKTSRCFSLSWKMLCPRGQTQGTGKRSAGSRRGSLQRILGLCIDLMKQMGFYFSGALDYITFQLKIVYGLSSALLHKGDMKFSLLRSGHRNKRDGWN